MLSQRCKNCTHYTAFYKQWSGNFSRLDNGYCSRQNIIKKQNEVCDSFMSNEHKEQIREKKRLELLERALTAIVEISQILKEKENQD